MTARGTHGGTIFAGSLAAGSVKVDLSELLPGVGSLALNAVQVPESFQPPVGFGLLQVAAAPLLSEAALTVLAGAGSLSAGTSVYNTISTQFAGASTLAVDTIQISTSKTLSVLYVGAGNLSALTTDVTTSTVVYVGSSSLSAVDIGKPVTCTLTGAGSFTASQFGILTDSAELFAGVGSFTALTFNITTDSVLWIGTSSLTANTFKPISTQFAGASNFSALTFDIQPILASFGGAGTVAVNATKQGSTTTWQGTALFTGAGSLSLNALRFLIDNAELLAGASNLSALTFDIEVTTVAFAGASTETISVILAEAGLPVFAGASTLTANSVKVDLAELFAGVGRLSVVVGSFIIDSVELLAGIGSLTANAVKPISAQFAGAGLIRSFPFASLGESIEGINDGWITIACNAAGSQFVAGNYSGAIATSSDGGHTWSIDTATAAGNSVTGCLFTDQTSTLLLATFGQLFRSTNFGGSWTPVGPSGKNWNDGCLACSDDGTHVFASELDNGWVSTDSGQTWSSGAGANLLFVNSSSDGSKFVGVVNQTTTIVISNDGGATWNPTAAQPTLIGGSPFSVFCSADGNILLVGDYGGSIWRSIDRGNTWAAVPGTGIPGVFWDGFSRRQPGADGSKVLSVSDFSSSSPGGGLYYSNDFGASWLRDPTFSFNQYFNAALSADGSVRATATYANDVAVYIQSGIQGNAVEVASILFAGAGGQSAATPAAKTIVATLGGVGALASNVFDITTDYADLFSGASAAFISNTQIQQALITLAGAGNAAILGTQNNTASALFAGAGSLSAIAINTHQTNIWQGTVLFPGAGSETATAIGVDVTSAALLGGRDIITPLLLHMDGPPNSTQFYDASTVPNVINQFGNAQISTAQSKFGGASASFDGANSYLSIPNTIGTFSPQGPFTIDFWIYPNAFSTLDQELVARIDVASQIPALQLKLASSVSSPPNVFTISLTSQIGLNNDIANQVSFGTPTLGVWQHIALAWDGNNYYCFLNGILGVTISSTLPPFGNNQPLSIGARIVSPVDRYANVFIDEFRFSGVAQWTSNFTPPSAPYANPVGGLSATYTIIPGLTVPVRFGLWKVAPELNSDSAAFTTLPGVGNLNAGTTQLFGHIKLANATLAGTSSLVVQPFDITTDSAELLAGSGILKPSATLQEIVSALLTGTGSLALNIGQVSPQNVSYPFTGFGNLSGLVFDITTDSAELFSGASSLTAIATQSGVTNVWQGSVLFPGAGTLAVSINEAASAVATLVGMGAVSVSPNTIDQALALFAGAGNQNAAIFSVTFDSNALLAGSGFMGSPLNIYVAEDGITPYVAEDGVTPYTTENPLFGVIANLAEASASSLTGAGNFLLAANSVDSAAAVFAGAGNQNASIALQALAFALFSGASSLTAIGIVPGHTNVWQGSSLFTGAGSLSALFSQINQSSTLLAGSGNLSAVEVLNEAASALLAGSGSFTAVPLSGIPILANLSGAGSLTVAAVMDEVAGAIWNGLGSLAVNTFKPLSTVQFAGVGSAAVTAVLQEAINALMAGSSTETVAAFLRDAAAVLLNGAGSLSAIGIETETASATFTGLGTLGAFTGGALWQGTALLAGSSSLIAQSAALESIATLLLGSGNLQVDTFNLKGFINLIAGTSSLNAYVNEINQSVITIPGLGNQNSTISLEGQIAETLSGSSIAINSPYAIIQDSAAYAGTGSLAVNVTPFVATTPRNYGTGPFIVMPEYRDDITV